MSKFKVGDRVRLDQSRSDFVDISSEALLEYVGDTGGEILRISRHGVVASVLWDTGRTGSYILTSLVAINGLDVMLRESFGD